MTLTRPHAVERIIRGQTAWLPGAVDGGGGQDQQALQGTVDGK